MILLRVDWAFGVFSSIFDFYSLGVRRSFFFLICVLEKFLDIVECFLGGKIVLFENFLFKVYFCVNVR